MNLALVRAALADLVGNVPNIRVFDYRPDAIPVGVADAVTIEPETAGDYVEYQAAFNAGLGWANYQLTVWVPASDLRSAHMRMDELLSSGTGLTRSIIDAVMADRTLGGVTGGMVVDRADPPRLEETEGGRRLVCDLHLRVPLGRL